MATRSVKTIRHYVEQASMEHALRLERQCRTLLAIGYTVEELTIAVWRLGGGNSYSEVVPTILLNHAG